MPLLHRSGLISKLTFALQIDQPRINECFDNNVKMKESDYDGLGDVCHEIAWNIFEHLIYAAMPMTRYIDIDILV